MSETDTQGTASCGPACGCDAEVPIAIACTLSSSEAADRTSEWAALRRQVTRTDFTPSGVRLLLPADPAIVAGAADLATREADCCAFFSFALHIEHGVAYLEVSAPAEGQPVLRALFAPDTS